MYFCAAAAPTKQLVLLGLGLGSSLLSLLVVEPLVSGQMMERYAMENAPVRDEGACGGQGCVGGGGGGAGWGVWCGGDRGAPVPAHPPG